MRDPVCDMSLFKDLGVRFKPEVRYGMKRIDLAGVSGDSRVYAIELKVERWREAAWQASLYQLCADFAFIAIREEYAHRVETGYLARLGIGLISVSDGVARLKVPACNSPVLDPVQHERLRDALAVVSPVRGE